MHHHREECTHGDVRVESAGVSAPAGVCNLAGEDGRCHLPSGTPQSELTSTTSPPKNPSYAMDCPCDNKEVVVAGRFQFDRHALCTVAVYQLHRILGLKVVGTLLYESVLNP